MYVCVCVYIYIYIYIHILRLWARQGQANEFSIGSGKAKPMLNSLARLSQCVSGCTTTATTTTTTTTTITSNNKHTNDTNNNSNHNNHNGRTCLPLWCVTCDTFWWTLEKRAVAARKGLGTSIIITIIVTVIIIIIIIIE